MTKTERVTQRVQAELLDHLRDLHKYGPDYISEYVETVVGPRTTRRPKVRMHPKLAALVRELALDAASMDQGLAGRLNLSTDTSRSGVPPLFRSQSPRRKPSARSVQSLQRDNDRPLNSKAGIQTTFVSRLDRVS